MRRFVAVVIVGALGGTHPATALEFKTGRNGVGGTLNVAPNLGVCGTLSFPPGERFVGELTAIGYLEGPGTQVATIRAVIPITDDDGAWSACISGGYPGATVGEGKFTLTGQSGTNDYTNVQQCVVRNGSLTCV